MVNVKDLKKFKGVDIDDFDGSKAKIVLVEIQEPQETNFNGVKEMKTQLLIQSENLSKDEGVEVTGREYVTLFEKDGELGFSESSTSKSEKIRKYFKIDSFDELVGKEVTILKKISGTGKERLGINYGG